MRQPQTQVSFKSLIYGILDYCGLLTQENSEVLPQQLPSLKWPMVRTALHTHWTKARAFTEGLLHWPLRCL